MTAAGRDDLTPEEEQRIVASRTRLEILLNPKEKDTIALLGVADQLLEGETLAQRRSSAQELVQIARRLLKREWVRIKKELTDGPS